MSETVNRDPNKKRMDSRTNGLKYKNRDSLKEYSVKRKMWNPFMEDLENNGCGMTFSIYLLLWFSDKTAFDFTLHFLFCQLQ